MDHNNGSYDASFSYSDGYLAGNNNYNVSDSSSSSMLRRRTAETEREPLNDAKHSNKRQSTKAVVKKLDFMFPKVDTEYTVQTDRGGMVSLIAYGMIAILGLAEILSWVSQNAYSTREHITVDTSLGKQMRVNLDITFPSLACSDLHIDIMDVAGDSQLDIADTMIKKRLNSKGRALGKEEVVQANTHRQQQNVKDKILKEPLPDDYCGPCYGAHEGEDQCCNTCDELLEAYKKKRWREDYVMQTAEQCIREGRVKMENKLLKRGEGCNLQGYFMVNRVGGNFHIAMGEGIERDGRHIHSFNPLDTHNFNASHVIHHLSFGPEPNDSKHNTEQTTLNGVSKYVTREVGATGLFQYFIKIVPTTYINAGKGGRNLETNRYFYTERFRPLLKEIIDDDDFFAEAGVQTEQDGNVTAVQAGHTGGHTHHDHHDVKKNSILPGIFFIYEIYPFQIEVSESSVPLTHLLIRLMATVGGVFTIVRWADSFLYSRERGRG